MKLGHMAITVKDMDAALDFYTRVLGCEKAFEIANPDTGAPWIVYVHVGGGQFIELFYGGETDNPWDSKLRGFNHVCLQVDDIQAATKRVQDAGYPMDKLPKMGCDNNWQAWITDPDGIRVELMQISPDSPHAKFVNG